jgi:hypothetical protein
MSVCFCLSLSLSLSLSQQSYISFQLHYKLLSIRYEVAGSQHNIDTTLYLALFRIAFLLFVTPYVSKTHTSPLVDTATRPSVLFPHHAVLKVPLLKIVHFPIPQVQQPDQRPEINCADKKKPEMSV